MTKVTLQFNGKRTKINIIKIHVRYMKCLNMKCKTVSIFELNPINFITWVGKFF